MEQLDQALMAGVGHKPFRLAVTPCFVSDPAYCMRAELTFQWQERVTETNEAESLWCQVLEKKSASGDTSWQSGQT